LEVRMKEQGRGERQAMPGNSLTRMLFKKRFREKQESNVLESIFLEKRKYHKVSIPGVYGL